MTTKEILKSYFDTGKIPTAAQFARLIDSIIDTVIYVYGKEVISTRPIYHFNMGVNPNTHTISIPHTITVVNIKNKSIISRVRFYKLINNTDITNLQIAWNELLSNCTYMNEGLYNASSNDATTYLSNVMNFFELINAETTA